MSDQTIPRRTAAVGEIFGRLTVISEAPRRGYEKYWLCQCICGSPPKEIRSVSLGKGTKSCGCLAGENRKALSEANTTHGKSKTPEYKTWELMWYRCTNPNNPDYEDYKNRKPPTRWRDFSIFLSDMGLKPTARHSIERVDNALPYGPDNCVWATPKEQSRNRSEFNRNIEYQGRVQCIAAWAEELGMQYETLLYRFNAGWPVEKAFTKGN